MGFISPVFIILAGLLVAALGYSTFQQSGTFIGGNTYTFFIEDAIKSVQKAQLCTSLDSSPFICDTVYDSSTEDVAVFRLMAFENSTDSQRSLISANFMYPGQSDINAQLSTDEVYRAFYTLDYISYDKSKLHQKEKLFVATNTVDVVYRCGANDSTYSNFNFTNTVVGTITPFINISQTALTPFSCGFKVDTKDANFNDEFGQPIEGDDGNPASFSYLSHDPDFILFSIDAVSPYPSSSFSCQSSTDPSAPIVFLGTKKADQMTNLIFSDNFNCIFTSTNDLNITTYTFDGFHMRYEGRLATMSQTSDTGLIWRQQPPRRQGTSSDMEWAVVLYRWSSPETLSPFALKHVYYNVSDPHQFDMGTYAIVMVCQNLGDTSNVGCKPVINGEGRLELLGNGEVLYDYYWINSTDDYNAALKSSISDLRSVVSKVVYKYNSDVFGNNYENVTLRLVLYEWYDDYDIRFLGASSVVYLNSSNLALEIVSSVLSILLVAAVILAICFGVKLKRRGYKQGSLVSGNGDSPINSDSNEGSSR